MKELVAVLIVGIVAAVAISAIELSSPGTQEIDMKTFASYEELRGFVKTNYESPSFGYYGIAETGSALQVSARADDTSAAAPEASAGEYSTTNIQVEGVDEADIVKNDGKYIYVVSGQKVVIIDAYPAENMQILSEIDLERQVNEIFISGDKLIIFSSHTKVPEEHVRSYYPGRETTVHVYDVSDRERPSLDREENIDGGYFDSRMIGNYVYFIATQGVYFIGEELPVPMFSPEEPETFPEIHYFDIPDRSYTFTVIAAINTQDSNEEMESEIFMMVSAQNMYVSQNNIYITHERRIPEQFFVERVIDEVFLPIVSSDTATQISEIRSSDSSDNEKMQQIGEIFNRYMGSLEGEEKRDFQLQLEERMSEFYVEIAKEIEKTVIHKISIDGGEIEYDEQGEAPGRVLNQFSMDEYKDNFRIATTTGHVSRTGDVSANHIYIFGSDLNIVGKLEDLAPGERIYSARFMGDRAYLVTFQKIDPLFVIDVSNPLNPIILGKLKIPGYSDYLHPFDDNHVIGVGKEATAAEEGNFAWYQGVKMSLFDVTDVEKPKEISKVEIGDRGTDSYALRDHKAFLFSRQKNLLVIPILLAEIDVEKYPEGVPPFMHGDYVWQGAYVYSLTLEDGFDLRGRVSHIDDDSLDKSGYFFYSPNSVKRSLYMEDTLYTVSDNKVSAEKINTLENIGEVELPFEQKYEYPFFGDVTGPIARPAI